MTALEAKKPILESKPDGKLCPSSTLQEGAILLGIVMPDGSVAYAKDRIVVDENFVRGTQGGTPAEQRFRFSSPCMKGACNQWTGSRCGVIDEVVEAVGGDVPSSLPHCSIRPQCRWFAQQGAAACGACPLVITDQRPLLQASE